MPLLDLYARLQTFRYRDHPSHKRGHSLSAGTGGDHSNYLSCINIVYLLSTILHTYAVCIRISKRDGIEAQIKDGPMEFHIHLPSCHSKHSCYAQHCTVSPSIEYIRKAWQHSMNLASQHFRLISCQQGIPISLQLYPLLPSNAVPCNAGKTGQLFKMVQKRFL